MHRVAAVRRQTSDPNGRCGRRQQRFDLRPSSVWPPILRCSPPTLFTFHHRHTKVPMEVPAALGGVGAALDPGEAAAAWLPRSAPPPGLSLETSEGSGWQEGVAAAAGRHYRACLTCRTSKIRCSSDFPCTVSGFGWFECVACAAPKSSILAEFLTPRPLTPPLNRGGPTGFGVRGRPPRTVQRAHHNFPHATYTLPNQRCFRLSLPCQPQFWRKDPHAGLRGTELVFKTVDPRVRAM